MEQLRLIAGRVLGMQVCMLAVAGGSCCPTSKHIRWLGEHMCVWVGLCFWVLDW